MEGDSGNSENVFCPLSWSVHHNLAHDGFIEFTCCCVQAKFLGMKTKILFSLYMVHSALFYNLFKALNLFLINMKPKFSCLAMAFGCSPEVLHRVWALLGIGD
jgi:hypothetical protein